jgi:ABC-2 type transport system permease protein
MSLEGTYAMVRVVAGKELALMKRYWLNTVSGLFTTYIMFLLLFLGGRTIAPATLDESLAGLIVGFFVWSLSWSAFQGPAQTITKEAQWGTLEQLYSSPIRFRTILAADVVAGLVFSLFTSSALLGLMMVTTGTYLRVDVVTVLPLVALTVGSAVGLGFAAGGLALLYKRISQLFLLLQFLLLVAITIRGNVLFQLLPLNLGTQLLTTAMDSGTRLWQLPTADLTLLAVKALAFLVLGGGVFTLCVRAAKRRGVMGHY